MLLHEVWRGKVISIAKPRKVPLTALTNLIDLRRNSADELTLNMW